jgi:type IV pilus assembly protein PilX
MKSVERPRIKTFIAKPPHRGVALVVVMIFIVALSSIALFAARNSSLAELLGRNKQDLQLAREAAEAALRDAEADLLIPSATRITGARCNRIASRPLIEGISQFDRDCSQGQCGLPLSFYQTTDYSQGTPTVAGTGNPGGEPWWPLPRGGQWNNASTKANAVDTNCDFDGAVPYGTFTAKPPLRGVSQQPEYLIELINFGPNRYFRISARGFGRGPNTEVVLQTYFKPFE